MAEPMEIETKIHAPKASDGTLRCLTLPPDLAVNLLENKNPHKFDAQIKFREHDHVYWLDGDSSNLVSSTTYIHQFFEEFNADAIIARIMGGRKWAHDESYKYYRQSKQTILDGWEQNRDQAASAGTALHADIEYHYNGLDALVQNDSKEYQELFALFKVDHPTLNMHRTEQMIFSKILRITGSVDGIAMNADGTITLIDWKRSKAINTKAFGGKRGLEPFDHLADCNYSHYCLQLNLYRTILEQHYGHVVREMFLVILHPQQADYLKIDVPRMETEGHLLFEFRRQQLIKLGLLEDVPESEHYHFKSKSDLFNEDDTPIFPQLCHQ